MSSNTFVLQYSQISDGSLLDFCGTFMPVFRNDFTEFFNAIEVFVDISSFRDAVSVLFSK
jgi:hypothetical protein